MPVNYIPKEYHTVTPYMMVENVGQVMNFLTATFGAESRGAMEMSDSRVVHAQILAGDSMLMLAEAKPPEWPSQPASFYLYVSDCDLAYKKAIAAGGTSI